MSRNKAKGTEWESKIVAYLLSANLPARRVVQAGARDRGDIHSGPFALEAKDVAAIDLAGFVDQAVAEARNAGKPYGAAVVKRRRRGVASGYVVMDLETFARLAAVLDTAERVNDLIGTVLSPNDLAPRTPGSGCPATDDAEETDGSR